MDVLEDRPELDAVARHQPHRAGDRLQPAEGGELVEQEQHGLAAGAGGVRASAVSAWTTSRRSQRP